MGTYAVHTLDWSSFGDAPGIQGEEMLTNNDLTVLPDGDQIRLREEEGSRFEAISTDAIRGVAPYEVRVVLQTAAKVTARKELKAMTQDGTAIASLSLQGEQHGPRYMVLQVREGKLWFAFTKDWTPLTLRIATTLIFSKTNVDGLLIATYELHHLDEKRGNSIIFSWESD